MDVVLLVMIGRRTHVDSCHGAQPIAVRRAQRQLRSCSPAGPPTRRRLCTPAAFVPPSPLCIPSSRRAAVRLRAFQILAIITAPPSPRRFTHICLGSLYRLRVLLVFRLPVSFPAPGCRSRCRCASSLLSNSAFCSAILQSTQTSRARRHCECTHHRYLGPLLSTCTSEPSKWELRTAVRLPLALVPRLHSYPRQTTRTIPMKSLAAL